MDGLVTLVRLQGYNIPRDAKVGMSVIEDSSGEEVLEIIVTTTGDVDKLHKVTTIRYDATEDLEGLR